MASFFQTGMGTQAASFGHFWALSRKVWWSLASASQCWLANELNGLDVSERPSETTTQTTATTPTTELRKNEKLTKEELEKEVEIVLEETETITTFKLFGQAVQEGLLKLFEVFSTFLISETENIELVKEQNDSYALLCANKEGNDKYVSTGMQTFNNKLKDKQTVTVSILKNNQACQASKSILWDAHVSGSKFF